MSYDFKKMARVNSRGSTYIPLYKKAIINSFCYKKADELRKELEKTKQIIWEMRENEQRLIDELHNAKRTIDTIQLLTKEEAILKQDIRELVKKKHQLQLDIYKIKNSICL